MLEAGEFQEMVGVLIISLISSAVNLNACYVCITQLIGWDFQGCRRASRDEDLGTHENSNCLGNNLITALWPVTKVRRKFWEN